MTALDPRPRSLDADPSVLVDAAIDGDDLAWTLLRDRFESQVRGVAAARVRDTHAVDDIVQDTFFKAWTRLHQLDDATRLGAWLKTIAANVAIDHIRSQRPTSQLDNHVERPIVLAPLEDHVVEREAASVLHEHLSELREVDRTALWQRDAMGASIAEVADTLGMTTGSVRVLLTRARGKVRNGYGALVLPVLGLFGRLRNRIAAAGDSVSIVVAAPALLVAASLVVVALPNRAPAAGDVDSGIVAAPQPSSPTASVGDREPVSSSAPAAAIEADNAPARPAAETFVGSDAPAAPARDVQLDGPGGADIGVGNPGEGEGEGEGEVSLLPSAPVAGALPGADLYLDDEDEDQPDDSDGPMTDGTCILCG